jgi:hypothetical protein
VNAWNSIKFWKYKCECHLCSHSEHGTQCFQSRMRFETQKEQWNHFLGAAITISRRNHSHNLVVSLAQSAETWVKRRTTSGCYVYDLRIQPFEGSNVRKFHIMKAVRWLEMDIRHVMRLVSITLCGLVFHSCNVTMISSREIASKNTKYSLEVPRSWPRKWYDILL